MLIRLFAADRDADCGCLVHARSFSDLATGQSSSLLASSRREFHPCHRTRQYSSTTGNCC